MNQSNKIRIGTRGSQLALAQVDLVMEALKQAHPELECEVIIIKTMGDKILDKPLLEFGGKGVFVTEFEEALLEHRIDIAVHSAKDMPMELAKGLGIVGVLTREDPRDVLITRKENKDYHVDPAIIGTSSLRRQVQLERLFPHITCTSLRGNVPTRLKKLSNSEYDGIVLAAAGLKRLQVDQKEEYNYRFFTFEEMIPAAGQGIIAIEGRMEDNIRKLMEDVSDAKAKLELETERNVLKLLDAGCHEPIGILSEVRETDITLSIMKEVNGVIRRSSGSDKMEKRLELVKRLVQEILEEC